MKAFMRRWFRFRLRTLLVLVALCAMTMGWVAAQFAWIAKRHHALRNIGTTISVGNPAPWPLHMFHERGVAHIYATPEYLRTVHSIEELQRLFPEAGVEPIEHYYEQHALATMLQLDFHRDHSLIKQLLQSRANRSGQTQPLTNLLPPRTN